MSKASDAHAGGGGTSGRDEAPSGAFPGADNEPLPGAVLTPRQARYLKVAIVGMGVLILVFLALIVATILSRSGGTRGASGSGRSSGPADIAAIRALYANQEKILYAEGVIPAGSRIVSSHLDGDRLVMMLERRGGASIMLFDLKAWKVIGFAQLDNQP